MIPGCMSTGQYVWLLALTATLAWVGVVVYLMGSRGRVRFLATSKLDTDKHLARALAIVLWAISAVILVTTVLGTGC